MIENKVTLSGGVVCEFGKLKGVHLENLTTQGVDYQQELINAVADVTKSIGTNKKVSKEDIAGLLPIDFYKLIIAIRNFSANSELCGIRTQWKGNDEMPLLDVKPVNCSIDSFEYTPSNLFKGEEKTYQIPNEVIVDIPSLGKVKMQVLTVGKVADLSQLYKNKKKSMLTELRMTQPKLVDTDIVLDVAELDYDAINDLFEAKIQIEGSIDLDVVLYNPQNPNDTKSVSILSQPSFFFRWVRK